MPRPKKYASEEQRLAAKRARSKSYPKRTRGKYWRLVIPRLEGYEAGLPHPHPPLESLKAEVCSKIRLKQTSRGLDGWCVAWQTHPTSGLPHLDILLTYRKGVLNTMGRYDYALKHGDLTRYKALNKAILEYGTKQDPGPVTNIDIRHTLMQQAVKTDIYSAVESEMVRDPFNFNISRYLNDNDLYRAASKTNYFKQKRLLLERQATLCHRLLLKRPGFKHITAEIMRQKLSKSELKTFRSWAGYQVIVDHLNQIPIYGFTRPHKTSNLLIVGRPGIGKTTLFRHLDSLVASYPMGTHGAWFPDYTDGVYSFLKWEEFTLTKYPYDLLLKLLEGQRSALPVKGSHAFRTDNQLITMTSNLTLDEHICRKFKDKTMRAHSRLNLAARVTEVVVPQGLKLFVLLKLL